MNLIFLSLRRCEKWSKTLAVFLFTTLATCHGLAQPFSLFSMETIKEFVPAGENWEQSYALKVDGIESGTDYQLHTLLNPNEPADFEPDENDPEECFGWGGCYANSRSAGFGKHIYSPEPHLYYFFNLSGDTLKLDLSADSSIIYENDEQFYTLVFEGEGMASVFGTTENVQRYRIGHYSEANSPIDSPLNGYEISIGENSGLLDFFLVDSFPEVERPLTLVGDMALDESLRALTAETIFDFQAGDTLQYKLTYTESIPFNPETVIEISFLNQIILNREEDGDSLRYTILNQSFDQGETAMTEYMEEVVYFRFDTLASLSFYHQKDSIGYHDASYEESLFNRDFCGENRIGLKGQSNHFRYCEEYNAWCGIDTDGPPEITEFEYARGMGLILHRTRRNGFNSVASWTDTKELVYSSLSNETCGQEAVLSATNLFKHESALALFPNPVSQSLNIRIAQPFSEQIMKIRIRDISGRLIDTYTLQETGLYDVSNLANGLYILEWDQKGKQVFSSKFMVQH